MLKKEPPPNKPPKLNAMVKIIASMGGYLNRKSDPDPGPTTIWIAETKRCLVST